jgi:Ca-activated chloride channel homolog
VAPLRVARTCAWLAIAGVVIAAAEPSIQPAPRQRVGILELVGDRSGSTAANDLAPTRLGAIQQATLALLDRVPERTRVGLVAFSDKAATLVRPTDRDAVRDGLASLRPDGGTAVGDALRRALDDIRAARPAAPAAVLLLSDGASSTGSYPPDAAREAAARHVPVFTVAVGTPNRFLSRLDRTSQLRRFYVPPDLALLAGIAGPTGGRAVEARSVPALHAALDDLGRDVGVAGEPREVTMLAAAAALLLLAVAGAVGRAAGRRRRGRGRLDAGAAERGATRPGARRRGGGGGARTAAITAGLRHHHRHRARPHADPTGGRRAAPPPRAGRPAGGGD